MPDSIDTQALARTAAVRGITLAVNRVDGFMFELAEYTLEGEHLSTWLGSYRLLRREAGIRYCGRIHEEPRARSASMDNRVAWATLPSGPHVKHLGTDQRLRALRAKDERNLRLARLRVADEPESAVAHYELVRAADAVGDVDLGTEHARRALALGVFQDSYEQRELRAFLACGTADWGAELG